MRIDIVEIGDTLVDRQHDNLLVWFCRLERAIFEEVAESVVDQIIGNLHLYVEEHFAYEEALMERVGYPGLRRHREEHREFRARLATFEQQRFVEAREVSRDLAEVLKSWIVEHINRADAALAFHLAEGPSEP